MSSSLGHHGLSSPNSCSEAEARLDQAGIVSCCLSSWNRKEAGRYGLLRVPGSTLLLSLRTRSAPFSWTPFFSLAVTQLALWGFSAPLPHLFWELLSGPASGGHLVLQGTSSTPAAPYC